MRRSLTKRERLRNRDEINRVFRSGKTVKCAGMSLAYASNGSDISRLVVIPARGHKNAVERNRSKRLGKEAFRSVKERILTGYDFAVVCYPGTYCYANRYEQLLQLLTRGRMLRDLPSEQS